MTSIVERDDIYFKKAADLIAYVLNDDWESSDGPWVLGQSDLKELCKQIALELMVTRNRAIGEKRSAFIEDTDHNRRPDGGE